MRYNLQVVLSILIVLLFLPFYNNAQNLVLYTTLDDASSITSPSTGPAGTQNNGSFAAAKYNDGFLSDGSNEYVTFSIASTSSTHENDKLNLDKGTIAFWYKASSKASSYFVSIGSYPNRFLIQIEEDFGDADFWFYPGDSNRNLGTVSYSSGDLIHIAAVWDNSGNTEINGGDNYGVYINGSLLGSHSDTWSGNSLSSSTMYIGSQFGSSGSSNGIIDDFYVYDDVLTSTQINNLKDSQVLPVELTSFSANLFENSVNLNWATATEVNNYGFEIERTSPHPPPYQGGGAEGGGGWKKIGFVNGHGNSNSPKYYSFNDKKAPTGELQYRLKQIDFDGAFEYSDVVTINNSQNYKFDLAQNYPNPFNPTTTISFTIPNNHNDIAVLKIYDILGREIKTLVNEQKSPGNYKIDFDASNFASGMYFYTLTSGSFRQTKKMLLIK